MQMSKTALAMGVSVSLLFGCNSDGLPVGSNTGENAGSEVTLYTGMWQLGEDTGIGLPNVYAFAEDGSHKYYDDDATPNTYEIKDASATVAAFSTNTQTVSFKLFDATGLEENATEIANATFDVSGEGELTISSDELSEPLSGSNKADDESVKGAVSDANEDAGIDNAVLITDTNKDGKEDTGELRLKVSDSSSTVGYLMDAGKVSLDLVYQRTEGSTIADVNENKVYITLYNEDGTSNSYHHGEISFGVEQGSTSGPIFYRDASGSLISTNDLIHLDENGVYTASIEMEWTANSHTFTINDVNYDGAVATPGKKVQVVAVRFGNNSKTTPYEIIVDNLVVSELNEAGDYVEVFSDNFNARPVGQELNSAPYNNNSYEAVVISLSDEEAPTDPVDPEVPVVKDPIAPGNPPTSDDFEGIH